MAEKRKHDKTAAAMAAVFCPKKGRICPDCGKSVDKRAKYDMLLQVSEYLAQKRTSNVSAAAQRAAGGCKAERGGA